MKQRQAVEHIGEPLTLLFPVDAESPDGVVQGLITHIHLGNHGLLGEVHQGTAQSEVLREVILPVQAQHGLTLHAIIGVILKRHIHIGTCVDDTLIEDGNLTSRVINGIVGSFFQDGTTGSDHNSGLLSFTWRRNASTTK